MADADAFNAFATTFMLAISIDNKVDHVAFERLVENLLNQKTSLEAATPLISGDIKPEILKYEVSLYNLNRSLPSARDATTTRIFWERVSDILVAKQNLYAKLRPIMS
jgi:hypothetical protein